MLAMHPRFYSLMCSSPSRLDYKKRCRCLFYSIKSAPFFKASVMNNIFFWGGGGYRVRDLKKTNKTRPEDLTVPLKMNM